MKKNLSKVLSITGLVLIGLILLALITLAIFRIRNNNQTQKPASGPGINLENNPPYTKVDWVQGKVLTKGGNFFDMDYKGATLRVQIPEEGVKYLDKNGQPSNSNFDSITVGSAISVQTLGGRIFENLSHNSNQKISFTEASAIVVGGRE